MMGADQQRGFSLVELLAVVLVLAVLAAVAVPLYTSQRRSAAGRACKANLAAIASAATSWALRNGSYPSDLSSLVGASEGLTELPVCPLTGYPYTWFVDKDTGTATLKCPNPDLHEGYGGTSMDEWIMTLAPPGADTLP